jgi:hypothetical protein
MSVTDDNSVYLPNETKNSFLDATSTNWNPYRYRYDIWLMPKFYFWINV